MVLAVRLFFATPFDRLDFVLNAVMVHAAAAHVVIVEKVLTALHKVCKQTTRLKYKLKASHL